MKTPETLQFEKFITFYNKVKSVKRGEPLDRFLNWYLITLFMETDKIPSVAKDIYWLIHNVIQKGSTLYLSDTQISIFLDTAEKCCPGVLKKYFLPRPSYVMYE